MLFHGALFELALFELPQEDEGGVVEKAVSDIISIAITEDADEILPDITVSDTLSLDLLDVAGIFGTVDASDTVQVSILDTLSILSGLDLSDQIQIGVDDSLDVLVLADVFDDISVHIADIAAVAAIVAASDTIDIDIDDLVGDLLVSLEVEDVLALAIREHLALTQWKRAKSAVGSIGAGSASGGIRSVRPLGSIGAGSVKGKYH